MFDLTNLDISKFPIVIYASPRTGCSIIGEILSKKFKQLQYFNEPLGRDVDPTEFIKYAHRNKTYIVKTMAYDVFNSGVIQGIRNQYPHIADDLQFNSFKIRIRRRSLLDQVTSNYIARSRDMWMYNVHTNPPELVEKFLKETVPIDDNDIRQCIEIIKVRNHSVDNIPAKIDLDLWYEDFDRLTDPTIFKTPQPANYEEIKSKIKDHL